MVTIYQTDLGLSDAKFREIGRIVAYWSLLEFLMGTAVGILKGLDRKEGRRLTLNKPVEAIVKLIMEAARESKLPKPLTAQMNSLLERIKKEHPRRNDVAHGVWGIHESKWSLLRYKKPDLVELGKGERMTARDLQQIANRAKTLTRDFERWLDTLPGRAAA